MVRLAAAHDSPDSAMNYDDKVTPAPRRNSEPDCAPHPFDVMAVYALYMRCIKARRPRAVFLALVVLLASGSSPAVVCGESGPRLWIDSLPLYAPRFSPIWTPDGGSIIFLGPSNHGGNIYVVSSDGSNLRRISKSKGNVYEIDYNPDISPSGDRIVYATSRHGGTLWDDYRGRNFEIETTDLKGEDRKRLTENGWHDQLPRWTADGEHIAFLGVSPHDPGSGGIIVMNAAPAAWLPTGAA